MESWNHGLDCVAPGFSSASLDSTVIFTNFSILRRLDILNQNVVISLQFLLEWFKCNVWWRYIWSLFANLNNRKWIHPVFAMFTVCFILNVIKHLHVLLCLVLNMSDVCIKTSCIYIMYRGMLSCIPQQHSHSWDTAFVSQYRSFLISVLGICTVHLIL